MTICSGTSANYYRCSDNKKRGNCSNELFLREDVLKARMLLAIRDHFMTPTALDYLRKKVVEILGEANRGLDEATREHRVVLARTEKRLSNLASAIAEGESPQALLTAMRDLERQAGRERQTS